MSNKLSGFQQVGIFHEVFGHPQNTVLQKDILATNPKLVNFRLSLIDEEKNELKDACDQKNFIEAIDAIADTLFVTYGMCHAFGINYDEYQRTNEFRPVLYDSDNVPDIHIFDKNLNKLTNELLELEQLVVELKKFCTENDMDNVIKVINCVVCQCYKISSLFRVNIDKCFEEVFRSNMTKVCATEEEARETVEWYKQNEKRYADPSYRKSPNEKYWVVFDNATSKILKSIKFELPNLKGIIFPEEIV